MPKAFICHSSQDSIFVLEVAKHLRRNLDGVFYYEDYQRSDTSFVSTINEELDKCRVFVIFVGAARLSQYQQDEVNAAYKLHQRNPRNFITVLLQGQEEIPAGLNLLATYPCIKACNLTRSEAVRVSKLIIHDFLGLQWRSRDGLPYNPHLFDYEKDIIQYFVDKAQLETEIAAAKTVLDGLDEGTPEHEGQCKVYMSLQERYLAIRERQLDGCPSEWTEVFRRTGELSPNELDPREVGNFIPDDAKVVAAALSHYHHGFCMTEHNLCFPEARPRRMLALPTAGHNLNVAVIVSGGIAPGINAVIDGITQRHHMYAERHHYHVNVYGIKDGFQAFDNFHQSMCHLTPQAQFNNNPAAQMEETCSHVSEGGSILGTSRFDVLLNPETRERELDNIVGQLFGNQIDILYIIGGDGSMKAAHAIWSFAQDYARERNLNRDLSVVAIPKTMDNDILWVWQTFGFLSAVERAREFIEDLATEVRSNPRLGVVQLFGSDSGFVVSHAVLASRTGICDAALIPEVDFSMRQLAVYLTRRMCDRHLQNQRGRIPYGFIVLAETAIPTDAEDYIDEPKIGLSEQEKRAVREFDNMRNRHGRIEGQTDDALRTAGLKIVSRGLLQLLPRIGAPIRVQPDWDKLRVFTNEPRHLLRSTPARTTDIITAQRLGILAVDNALAGYTDFMVSQWLTEYVLVPLNLVVLGRKRIPKEGIFWKSVLAKTGQPFDLV